MQRANALTNPTLTGRPPNDIMGLGREITKKDKWENQGEGFEREKNGIISSVLSLRLRLRLHLHSFLPALSPISLVSLLSCCRLGFVSVFLLHSF
jgi:hypothetical protein